MKLKMLRGLVTSVIFCAVSLVLVSSASAQGKQDFDLVNRTGITIVDVYITPHSAADWGDSVFGADPLKDGESTTIVFSRKEKAKFWDLYVVDTAGNHFQWDNLNLLEINEVTLTRKCVVTFTTK